jgi:hypothetical protein
VDPLRIEATMFAENPIKTVALCFYRSGAQTELHIPSASPEMTVSLPLFLDATCAAILAAENFSDVELSYLRGWGEAFGRPVFVEADCASGTPIGRGRRCEKSCALRAEAPSRGADAARASSNPISALRP